MYACPPATAGSTGVKFDGYPQAGAQGSSIHSRFSEPDDGLFFVQCSSPGTGAQCAGETETVRLGEWCGMLALC